MVRAIMHGCNGHMGQVITQLVREDDGIEIVAGIDLADNRDNGYPVYTDIWACREEADVIIMNTCSVREHAESRVLVIVMC